MEKLTEFIKRVQSEKAFGAYDEAATKQGIVLKILSLLEWDPFDMDDVQPEFSVKGGKIDYALRSGDKVEAFLMVKKEEKNVKGRENELVAWAAEEKAGLAVFTDGFTWRLFSPLEKSVQGEKKFHTIDLKRQKPEGVSKSFQVFLSKANVASGKASKAAENIFRIRQREALLHQHLPSAWQRVMNEPEKWLGEILAKATTELCGYSPDRETVEKFIRSKTDLWGDLSSRSNPTRPKRPDEGDGPQGEGYESKAVSSFTFNKKTYRVDSWQEMLVKLCELICAKRPDDFEMVLTLANQDKEYFSEIPYKFLNCEKIPGSNMYVDAELSPDEIVGICHEMLPLFGYAESELAIETKHQPA